MKRVSIVIPTRNRPAMADLAIRYALAAAGQDDEVVVADNSDTPLALEVDDPRVRILRTDRHYAMRDNWERAVAAARGETIVVVGDKHRLVPGSLDQLLRARSSDADVVAYSLTTFYQNVSADAAEVPATLDNSPGDLCWPAPRSIQRRLSREMLSEWHRTVHYRPDLPMLYTALVPRSVLDAVVRRHGRLFLGTSPDVSSGLHILAETDSYVETGIAAVVVQLPSADERWGNGVSIARGGKRGLEFQRELGGKPFGQMPPLVTTGVYQEILDFSRSRPDLAPEARGVQAQYARSAAAEIEREKPPNRLDLHYALLRSTQADGVNASALLAQARAILIARFPVRMRRVVRGAVTGVRVPPHLHCASLAEAVASAAEQNGRCPPAFASSQPEQASGRLQSVRWSGGSQA